MILFIYDLLNQIYFFAPLSLLLHPFDIWLIKSQRGRPPFLRRLKMRSQLLLQRARRKKMPNQPVDVVALNGSMMTVAMHTVAGGGIFWSIIGA
ncbi:hypothetical protein DFH07DRAFT_855639 [Mycena maculata]|uniref:Uncharacterized protein n=1 Tax=Mycena maculata TaxID=230809 RepID=A0AAD7MN73_9AGAR|nr:hypothetical protein DFH07DRAFT_855639 [Mycena maculata]